MRYALVLTLSALAMMASDAKAIEMFTFYGNGELYAGGHTGAHYSRAMGAGEHYAGTPFWAYAENGGAGYGYCPDGKCAHVWDGYCTEKQGCRKHHGHRHTHHKHGCRSCGNQGCGRCLTPHGFSQPMPTRIQYRTRHDIQPTYQYDDMAPMPEAMEDAPMPPAPVESTEEEAAPMSDEAPAPPQPQLNKATEDSAEYDEAPPAPEDVALRLNSWPKADALFPASDRG